MGSILAERILKCYRPPESFQLVIVYGPLGVGKSAYQFKVTVDVLKRLYNVEEGQAWEMVKSLIVFHPEQFFQKLREARQMGVRIPVLNWDDAGLWLYAMDWDDPFIIAFTKWLNVARTQVACLICSTPSPQFLFKKLRSFPQAITVRVISWADEQRPADIWRRVAKGYRHFVLPDLRRTRVHLLFKDFFSCRLPDRFFKWYKPLRDTYAELAKKLMEEKWLNSERLKNSKALQYYKSAPLPPLHGLGDLDDSSP